MDEWGERARLACRFGRRARTIGRTIWFGKGFRRDAENGNRDGRAPPFLRLQKKDGEGGSRAKAETSMSEIGNHFGMDDWGNWRLNF